MPKTRAAYWRDKFESNVRRDNRNVKSLRKQGWTVVTVWECETKRPEKVGNKLARAFKKKIRSRSRVNAKDVDGRTSPAMTVVWR